MPTTLNEASLEALIESHLLDANGYAKASQQNEQTIRIAHDDALKVAMLGLMKDHTQLYKLYANNKDFKRALADALFRLTMGDEAA